MNKIQICMREREGKKKRITGEEHGIFKLKDSLKKKKKRDRGYESICLNVLKIFLIYFKLKNTLKSKHVYSPASRTRCLGLKARALQFCAMHMMQPSCECSLSVFLSENTWHRWKIITDQDHVSRVSRKPILFHLFVTVLVARLQEQ